MMTDGREMTAAVALGHVTHCYGKAIALQDVSLTLPVGASIALVGPDGVGKSTLLALVSGVKRLQNGGLCVLGNDISDANNRQALSSRIAFMPQGLGHNLYPTLSVYENVDFFARLFGLDSSERHERIQRLLQATGLSPFYERPAGKLSGGMKQKLGLCCALVHDPDLLILDEPTTGVDPLSRRQFWALVETLRQERGNMTVVVSTAYMDEAEGFEHLVAMDGGRVLAEGSPDELKQRTGYDTLEAAYIALLPPERRPPGGALEIPPWQDQGGAPAIEANHLTRRFGDFVAVDDVSFRIGRGEIFGFLGSNGCGKSTTMKMLTGLLDITGGTAELLGQPIRPGDMATRMRVGYMSQAFSLYEELSVRRNLTLHAQLYRMAAGAAAEAVNRALDEFDLRANADALPSALPLGIRQRLQLAAACLHRPEILILDEPTSGVDPAARDMFWSQLVTLSRKDGVTIFVSTHFMNEAERCDRISLMHRGKVLAVGTPKELADHRGDGNLENAFVAYLENAASETSSGETAPEPQSIVAADIGEQHASVVANGLLAWFNMAWTFARREALELGRDRLRLTFALVGPIILLCISAYSLSFDVENVRFAVVDHDRSFASRSFVEQFQGSRYFVEEPSPVDRAHGDAWLRDGKLRLLIDIPPGFGRDLDAGRQPTVDFAIDGAVPFTGANVRAYASAIALDYMNRSAKRQAMGLDIESAMPIGIQTRFVYNQEFRSIYAMAPGVIMLTMILIPTMLTALGVVREKEVGSIINLYASPASIGQFLIGKQLPYAALATVSFLSLVLLTVTLLAVPLKGSFVALFIGGALFVLVATALGLLMSALVSSQVAAIFGTALLCLIPSVNFSGLLYPVSTLTGSSYAVGLAWPASWFQLVSLGTFSKGLGVSSFGQSFAMLGGTTLICLIGARLLLRKQES
ncbi:ribosome-associated ATPase/putative transporter RbbA [Cupriavidus basilensis]